MPFTIKARRAGALTGEFSDPGDLCFKQYKAMMDMWVTEGRWTTIDTFAKRVWPEDNVRAAALALLVFMYRHGFKYEDVQCQKNGDIAGEKIVEKLENC